MISIKKTFYLMALIFFIFSGDFSYGAKLKPKAFKKYMAEFYKKDFDFYMIREGKELYTYTDDGFLFKGKLGRNAFLKIKTLNANPVQSYISKNKYIKLMKIIYKDSMKGFIYVFRRGHLVYIVKKNRIIKMNNRKLRDPRYQKSLMAIANQGVNQSRQGQDGENIKVKEEEVEYTNLQTKSSWYGVQVFTGIVNGSYMTVGGNYAPYFKLGVLNLELIPKIGIAPGKTNKNETFLVYNLSAYVRNYFLKSYVEFGTGLQKVPKFKYTDPILSIGGGYKQKIVLFDNVFVNLNYISSQTPRYEMMLGLEYRE